MYFGDTYELNDRDDNTNNAINILNLFANTNGTKYFTILTYSLVGGNMTEYKIYPSLHEESNEGWVWIPEDIDHIKTRDFIMIRRTGHPSIRCQARTIDKLFINFYNKRLVDTKFLETYRKKSELTYENIKRNKSTIIISYYFRDKLGITNNDIISDNPIDLSILKNNCWWQKIKAFLQHPNDIVKIATWLALLSVIMTTILGIVSIIF